MKEAERGKTEEGSKGGKGKAERPERRKTKVKIKIVRSPSARNLFVVFTNVY